MSKKYLGSVGENIALNYYLKKGYVFLAKNYFTRFGEIDLVLSKDNIFYAIEVKTRTNYQYGFGEETIDENKIKKMRQATYLFAPQADWRLEVIVIYLQNKRAKIKIFPIYDY